MMELNQSKAPERCLRILYIGERSGNSLFRSNALSRLGHNVEFLDLTSFMPGAGIARRVLSKTIYEFGAAWLEPYFRGRLFGAVGRRFFDIVWVNQCELVGSASAELLRNCCRWMVAFNNDDPFGGKDKKRFSLYRGATRYFDLVAVVREPNVSEAYANGAAKVIRVRLSADEIAHAPVVLSQEDLEKWHSEVCFIGTWMPERGPILARLLELKVPLTLYGDRWYKASEWPLLRRAWRGPALNAGNYVKAIQSSEICIGLLSKDNRDQHTQRSAEIPYIGSLLCAERTAEHLIMYVEDSEAVFWNSPEECAEKCFALLGNRVKKTAIAKAGRQRCIQSRYLNEPVVQSILDALTNAD